MRVRLIPKANKAPYALLYKDPLGVFRLEPMPLHARAELAAVKAVAARRVAEGTARRVMVIDLAATIFRGYPIKPAKPRARLRV